MISHSKKGVSLVVFFVLVTEEVRGELVGAAQLADGRARLAAQPAAHVSARQAKAAALVARRVVTWLVTTTRALAVIALTTAFFL